MALEDAVYDIAHIYVCMYDIHLQSVQCQSAMFIIYKYYTRHISVCLYMMYACIHSAFFVSSRTAKYRGKS
jgi:hypothetical protein